MELRTPREMEIARNAITSRIENMEYGQCPICHDQMICTEANGHNVIACIKDKVIMPTRSDE